MSRVSGHELWGFRRFTWDMTTNETQAKKPRWARSRGGQFACALWGLFTICSLLMCDDIRYRNRLGTSPLYQPAWMQSSDWPLIVGNPGVGTMVPFKRNDIRDLHEAYDIKERVVTPVFSNSQVFILDKKAQCSFIAYEVRNHGSDVLSFASWRNLRLFFYFG